MLTPRSARLLALLAIGLPAVALLVLRRFPGLTFSFQFFRQRRDRRNRGRASIETARAYHESLPADAKTSSLDDRSWRDLDLDEVFLSLDRTASEPGRQYLYHLLRTPRYDSASLERLESAVRELAANEKVTNELRASLGCLDDPRSGQLVNLVLGELPHRPRLWWIFPLLTMAAVACLVLIAFWPRALVIWLGIMAVNIGVQLLYKPRVKRFAPAVHELPAFLGVAHTLGALELSESAEETRCLRDGARRLGVLRRSSSWLMFEPGEANDVAASIYEYANILFLLDVNAFVFTIDTLRGSQELMLKMFESIGRLDALQSIAAWRLELSRWSVPELTEERKVMYVEGLVHPLLGEAVPNGITVSDESILITGSNMSGKTTFIRALGVGAVLAQTLHTVCAELWRAPILRVRTSIGRSDSIVDGKSYYLAEVESVRALVRAKESGKQHLFLLDEIFRGTNTTERVAAASAVLSYLDRGSDLVVVATHDIEVLNLLDGAYRAYHFRERIDGGALSFDYLLHEGPSSTRNAIALLRLMEYPDDLVESALAAIDWQREISEPTSQPAR